MVVRGGLLVGLVGVLACGAAEAQRTPSPPPPSPSATPTRTIQEALAITYATNPGLQSQRALLRATDENVPAALAGWHPQVTVSAEAGYANGNTQTKNGPGNVTNLPANQRERGENAEGITVTQPLYRGGATRASTNKAENTVMGQRARLLASEEEVFVNTVNAYVGVIQAQQQLALQISNEQVLARQLQATNDRFRVGEITRTDVAQAEAALASATASRQTAEGNLQTARATYQQYVGESPDKLVEPQPLRLPAKTEEEAKGLSVSNNPNVIAARFDQATAKDNFDLQYSKLMPNLSLQGSWQRSEDTIQKNQLTDTQQILAVLSIPIYQGGSEYAAIRQARQQVQQAQDTVGDQIRTAVQQATSAWETYIAAKATIDSTRSAIRANEIALEGVEREAIVGSRTTLDVLNAQQAVLNSRTTLVQNLATFVTASYQVAAAVGRLTARDLNLSVPYYDDTAYYKAVRNLWIGTGDYATDQPGR